MLNISTRTWMPWVLAKRKSFETTRSACQKSGPRRKLRGRLPNVPGCGVVNAAGLSQRTPSRQVGIHAGDQVGALRAAAVAAGDVGDRHAVHGDVVGPGDGDVQRHAAAGVDDGAHAPAALPEPVERQLVGERAVEGVRDVLRVDAVLGVEVEGVLRGGGFVRALGRAAVARVLVLQAAAQTRAEAPRGAELQRVVAAPCRSPLVG